MREAAKYITKIDYDALPADFRSESILRKVVPEDIVSIAALFYDYLTHPYDLSVIILAVSVKRLPQSVLTDSKMLQLIRDPPESWLTGESSPYFLQIFQLPNNPFSERMDIFENSVIASITHYPHEPFFLELVLKQLPYYLNKVKSPNPERLWERIETELGVEHQATLTEDPYYYDVIIEYPDELYQIEAMLSPGFDRDETIEY